MDVFEKFDDFVCSHYSGSAMVVVNIRVTKNSLAQVALSDCLGDLEARMPNYIALSAFMFSLHIVWELVNAWYLK